MLRKFSRKVSYIWSKIRLLIWRRAKPKVVIRRFKRQNSRLTKRSPTSHLHGDKDNQTSQMPIRVATFNVALFSLAAALPKADENSAIGVHKDGDALPKSILKQSPLHPAINGTGHLAKKVSINLPENEISLAQNKVLRIVEDPLCNKNHVPMRSPVCFPLSMISWMNDQDHDDGSQMRGTSRSIFDVLKEVDADILALQDVKAEEEKGMKPLSDLAFALGMNYVFAESWAPEYGNAILSKWPIRRSKVQKICNDQDFRNVLKATIDVPCTGEVNFYCTQLDHLDESWRMKQINAIIQSSDRPHILAGGINSLSSSDYSMERWTNIVKYYEEMGKPTPRAEVMNFLNEKHYTDAKHFAGECEPVVMISKGQSVQGTCKYGTRVDYILASRGLKYQFVPGSYSVLSSKGTSDHQIVKVDLVKVHDCQGNRRRKKMIKQKILKITSSCSLNGMWGANP